MIFSRDFVSPENHFRVASLVTEYRYSRQFMHYSLYHMPSKEFDGITYPFSNGCTVELWEWISNSIQHFMMDAITYPC